MQDSYQHYIDGKFVDSVDGGTYQSISPSTGESLYDAAAGTAMDVEAAVSAAQRAFQARSWSALTATQRGRLLRRLGDLLAEHAGDLSIIEASDSGRLLTEMQSQLAVLPDYYHYYAGMADKVHGDVIPPYVPGSFAYTLREPLGVIGGMVPWNAPLSLAALKIAPALAAGNTIVIKPSEHTAASLLSMMPLLEEAGFPEGVVNVVTGLGEVGAALASHPGIAKISFTGGTETGRLVARAAVEHLAQGSLELGGKSPQVVFADADPELVVQGLVNGVFKATGQSCVAGSRAIVHASVYDELLERLVSRLAELRIGDPLDCATDIGPLAFEKHRAHVEYLVGSAVREGATLVTGGRRPDAPSRGWYYTPTVFSDVTPDMTVMREEVFGPVLGVVRFETEDEAVALANGTRFGLAAGLWTSDIARAHRVAARLDAGTVWVNQYRASTPLTPMGGFKSSGWGKEGGPAGIDEYLRLKVVSLGTSAVGTGNRFQGYRSAGPTR